MPHSGKFNSRNILNDLNIISSSFKKLSTEIESIDDVKLDALISLIQDLFIELDKKINDSYPF